MDLVIITLKALGAYLVLMLVGVNLIGGVFRSIALSVTTTDEFISPERERRANVFVIFFFTALLIGYLYTLYHFFNMWLILGAVMIIIARIPDLLWEMRTGQKITRKNMPRTSMDVFFGFVDWLAIPAIWYSFYIS